MKIFKSLRGGRHLYLALIFDEKFPVMGGKAWAVCLIEADVADEAASKLAVAGGQVMEFKDAEFYKLPPEIADKLKHIRRNIPIGDPDPEAREIMAAVDGWLEPRFLQRRTNDHGQVSKMTTTIPVGKNEIVALTADVVRPPKKSSVH